MILDDTPAAKPPNACLLFAPASWMALNALLNVDNLRVSFLQAFGAVSACVVMFAIGASFAAPATAIDDETLLIGLDQDVSDDGLTTDFDAAVKEYTHDERDEGVSLRHQDLTHKAVDRRR